MRCTDLHGAQSAVKTQVCPAQRSIRAIKLYLVVLYMQNRDSRMLVAPHGTACASSSTYKVHKVYIASRACFIYVCALPLAPAALPLAPPPFGWIRARSITFQVAQASAVSRVLLKLHELNFCQCHQTQLPTASSTVTLAGSTSRLEWIHRLHGRLTLTTSH